MARSAQSRRLEARLKAIPVSVRQAVTPTLMKAAEELAGAMKSAAPVDEGDLRDSIEVTPPGQSTPPYSQPGGSRVAGETEVIITAGGEDVRYPHLVEYGSVHGVAQPFFWPIYRLLKKREARRIKRAIGKAVRDGWGKA